MFLSVALCSIVSVYAVIDDEFVGNLNAWASNDLKNSKKTPCQYAEALWQKIDGKYKTGNVIPLKGKDHPLQIFDNAGTDDDKLTELEFIAGILTAMSKDKVGEENAVSFAELFILADDNNDGELDKKEAGALGLDTCPKVFEKEGDTLDYFESMECLKDHDGDKNALNDQVLTATELNGAYDAVWEKFAKAVAALKPVVLD